jgi:hypothetical protein
MPEAESLSLSFPEIPVAARKGDHSGVLARFERMARDPDSPIRAIRRTPAREAECVSTHRRGAKHGDCDAHREREDALLQPAGIE